MAYQVKWSDEAIITFGSIVDYLRQNFSEKEVTALVNAVEKKIRLIEVFPEIYRKSPRFKNNHYTNILRRTMLVYRINHQALSIELIHFWDSRQDASRFDV